MKAKITEPQFRMGLILVTTLFFMWGLSYGLVDVLNKHFQEALHISKAQSGLIQAAYFGAYFVIALPAGLFIEKKRLQSWDYSRSFPLCNRGTALCPCRKYDDI